MQFKLEQQQSYHLFTNSIRSDETRKTYTLLLKKFIEYLDEDDIFFGNGARQIERRMIDFIIFLKQQGKGYSSIHNYVASVISFYKINDVILNVSKISKFMPEQKKARKDRSYTIEEIHKILGIANERMQAVILLLTSTGMRIGAIPSLRIRNLKRVNDLYKITISKIDEMPYVISLIKQAYDRCK